jgi:uncharacterized membrane protein
MKASIQLARSFAMTLGPLDYLVVGFPGNQFKGEIAPAINEARQKGIIRLVDLVFILKDQTGGTVIMELTDMPEDVKTAFRGASGDVAGLLTAEDISTLAQDVPPGNSALIVLYEHTWAIRIKEALINANGVLITQGRIPQELHADFDDELDAHMDENAKLRAAAAE